MTKSNASKNILEISSSLSGTRNARYVLLTGIYLISGFAAQASTSTWTGASGGDWGTAANWNSGIGPVPASGDTALFNATGTTTVANAIANQAVTNISFDTAAGNYTIGTTGGSQLQLQSGGATQILSTLTATNAIETINAPIVLQGANGAYTFANNSANGTGAGAGTLNFGGGITGGAAGATVLTLSGSNTNANTISGVIGNGSATSLAISKSGAGTWALSGLNTYSGGTALSSGTLAISGTGTATGSSGSYTITNGALGTGTLTFSGGTLATSGTANVTIYNNISTSGTDTVNISSLTAGTVLTLAGNLSGNGSITQNGPASSNAIVALSGNNSGFSGTYTVAGSAANIIQFNNANAGSASAAWVLNTGNNRAGNIALTIGGGNTIFFGSLAGTTGGGTTTLRSNSAGTTTISVGALGASTTFAAPIVGGTNNIALTVTGGNLTLTGANTYTGATTISGGTLTLGTGGALATGSAITDNGTFAINSTGSMVQGTAFATTFSGSGGFSQVGSGTTTLNGANTYTGVTAINGGTLNVGSAETAGTSGPLGKSAAANPGSIVFGGGTLQYSASNHNDYSGRFSTAASQAYSIDANGQNISFATALTSSGGSLTLKDSVGTGTLTLSAANTYSGATTISAGTLLLNNVLAVQNSIVTISAGTGTTGTNNGLQFQSGLGGAFTVGGLSGASNEALLDTAGSAVALTTGNNNNTGMSYSGVLSGGGSLTKTGTGTQTLTGSNTFTGIVSINNGAISVNSLGSNANGPQPLGENVGLNLGNASTAGTLTYTGASDALDKNITLGSAGGIFNDASTQNFGVYGTITGSGNITISSTNTGTVFLAGANNSNSFTGNLIVTSGSVRPFGIGGSGITTTPLNANNVVAIASGASMQMGTVGNTLTIAGLSSINGNDGGALSGGTVNGTVTFGGSGNYSSSDTVSVIQKLAISLTGSGSQTLSGNLSFNTGNQTNGLTVNSGLLTLSGTNSYLGTTVLNSSANGTILNIQGANALSTGNITVNSGATLQIQGGITTGNSPSTTISGTGAAGTANTGTGALENVSGTNSYTGQVTLAGATTIASDAGTLNLTATGTIGARAII